MRRLTTVLRKGYRAIEDSNLLRVLQSEIRHEQSLEASQSNRIVALGDFVLDWDSPQTRDVVWRKRSDLGEEVAVSAMLGTETFGEEGIVHSEALMKVCIKKPGLSSILQFDCGVSSKGDYGSEFGIHSAFYIESSTSLGSSVYRGPLFSSLDPCLQDELKQYLVARGIDEIFTNILLRHLQQKEQGQYLNWLQKLEGMVAQSE